MKWFLAILLLIVAVVSGGSVVLLKIGNMMTPGAGPSDGLTLTALGLIVMLSVSGLVMAFKVQPAASTWWLIAAGVLVAVTAFVPQVVDWNWKAERSAERAAENRKYIANFLADLDARKQDIDARVEARRPYTPEEAKAFVEFVRRSNLYYVHGPDYMVVAMPLLQRALEGKVLDPNIIVASGRADVGPEPMFLHLHRWIRQAPKQPVLTQDWNIFLLLVSKGADLSTPGAEAAAADLRKTVTPVYSGLYIELN